MCLRVTICVLRGGASLDAISCLEPCPACNVDDQSLDAGSSSSRPVVAPCPDTELLVLLVVVVVLLLMLLLYM
jgi:hypothetical protein